jgi:hypothetical protein
MAKRGIREELAERGGHIRASLDELTVAQRRELVEELIYDFFVTARLTLLKWSDRTGQSAQIDTGYIAQHLASLLLSEPGQGFRGKGLDLADGSEVKSASIVSGVDRPRWNHNLGKPSDDEGRRQRGLPTAWEVYLAAPTVVYVLFDHPNASDTLRIRVWCVDGQEDVGWRDLVERFVAGRKVSQYNLQLHPPTGRDDDIVTNELGNLDMTAIKVMQAEFSMPDEGEELVVEWTQVPHYPIRPIAGRTKSIDREAVPEQREDLGEEVAGLTDLENVLPEEGEELKDKAVAVRASGLQQLSQDQKD